MNEEVQCPEDLYMRNCEADIEIVKGWVILA